MYKKIILSILTLTLACGTTAMSATAATASAGKKSVTDYTYTITPILSPFNEYFFVKTDNPDPTSFRFVDKSSVYDDYSYISVDWDDEEVNLYADIKYENSQTGRVNGGYIFRSYGTDGGEITLQAKDYVGYGWEETWSDTKIKLRLPALKDNVDYLIDTYATKSSFFDNMDAVEDGFSSICLYRGSYIRGELYKASQYWSLSSSPHKDQSFYIQSPYFRKDNKSLFASTIYPYCYDSLGFPSMMVEISRRLDASSSYVWDSDSHSHINVTYGGKTKRYGGQGNGIGQGISEDKIKQYFTFGTNGTKITLESARQLLNDYAAIEMEDDVPRENALTWESVCETVDSGAWVRLIELSWGESAGYSYLYKKGDGKDFRINSAGNNGSEIYWGGDLGYAFDTWVDGRYVDSWECFVPGEKFEDHPTSSILLRNVTIPQITYDMDYIYNTSTREYEYGYTNIQITEKERNVLFYYSADDNIWTVSSNAFDDDCALYYGIVEFVEKGLIDEKYLDMVTLTPDEVKALKVDRNTNTVPDDYYIYDGTTEPGTSLKNHKHNYTSKTTKQPTCTTDGVKTFTCTICGATNTETIKAIGHKYSASWTTDKAATCTAEGSKSHHCTICGAKTDVTAIPKKSHTYKTTVVAPTYAAQGYTLHKCSSCGTSYKDKYTAKKTVPTVTAKSTYTCTTNAVRINWNKLSGVTGYKIYRYNPTTKQWTALKAIYDPNVLTYKDSSLKSGTVYKYKVKAFVKSNGKFYFGSSCSTITTATKPATATITKTAKSSTAVRLYWKKVTCTGYKIQRYNDKTKKWADVTKVSTSTTSYRISGLKKNTTYKFRVLAYRYDGKKNVPGAWSYVTVKTAQ